MSLMWVKIAMPDTVFEVTHDEVVNDLRDGGGTNIRLCERRDFERYNEERQAMEATVAIIERSPHAILTARGHEPVPR